MTALAQLLLDFEHYGRDLSRRLGAGTPRAILVGVVDAKLATGTASLTEAASAAGMPLGTLKAARSRVEGLREAMDEIGRGPRDWPDLADELAAVTRFWRDRSPEQKSAWVEAFNCQEVHRRFDADEANDYAKLAMRFWGSVTARKAFERMWSDAAPWVCELIDLGHRAVEDPLPWQREAVA
jgi:hypothetical protein